MVSVCLYVRLHLCDFIAVRICACGFHGSVSAHVCVHGMCLSLCMCVCASVYMAIYLRVCLRA